tara:strand:- start:200 stop:760 length:561 start_codon:yes stop_codon:yes gene_type:complete
MKENLTGKVLIAMPQLADPRFAQSLIYICGHDENGAMGLVVNRTIESHTLSELIVQLNLETIPANLDKESVFFGGPVEMGRGFVLHSNDYYQEGTIKVSPQISLTATLDILEAIAKGEGPEKRLCALGYAGWGEGQLEAELFDNCWLQCEEDLETLFDTLPDQKWKNALGKMGIHPELLSSDAGHA